MKINIVSSGYVYNNVRSLLFPLINFRNFFKEKGIELNFLKKINVNCDILFIESNFIGKRYVHDFNNLKYEFKKLGKIVDKIIYFDTSDSTSILHPKLINYVNVYCKGQIFKDLNQYKYKYYGNRIFTHFAYKNFGIIDDNISFSEKCKKIIFSMNDVHVFMLSKFSFLKRSINYIQIQLTHASKSENSLFQQ